MGPGHLVMVITKDTENPFHVYNSPGNYTVTLIAANSIGSAVKTRTEYIYRFPIIST